MSDPRTVDRHRTGTHRGRTGEISPHKLAHIVLRTPRFAEARRWWAEVLGAEEVYADDVLALLTYDEEHHRVALVNDPQATPVDRATGLEHVAFTYAGLGDLLATYQRLAARGIRPYWCINHGPTTSLYYRDPDGHQVELQIDNFDTDEELVAFIRSEAFARNPIGVEVDPDELLTRYRAGEEPARLLRRGDLAKQPDAPATE